jgi:hypothetical protein
VIEFLFITSKTKDFAFFAPVSRWVGVRFPDVELPSEHCN